MQMPKQKVVFIPAEKLTVEQQQKMTVFHDPSAANHGFYSLVALVDGKFAGIAHFGVKGDKIHVSSVATKNKFEGLNIPVRFRTAIKEYVHQKLGWMPTEIGWRPHRGKKPARSVRVNPIRRRLK